MRVHGAVLLLLLRDLRVLPRLPLLLLQLAATAGTRWRSTGLRPITHDIFNFLNKCVYVCVSSIPPWKICQIICFCCKHGCYCNHGKSVSIRFWFVIRPLRCFFSLIFYSIKLPQD